jgi:dihydrodipicolinate synthase/N-acetylneuraminate lyase
MKPLKASDLKGNWATVLCAWNVDDSLDLVRIDAEIDALIAAKVDGIYTNGTTGEFHTQLEDEFDQLSELVATKCNKANMPFQIGVSHMSAQISRERLSRIIHLKPSAVQLIFPEWIPTTEEESVRFLSVMAEVADGIGLVLYNPPHAKKVFSPLEIGSFSRQVNVLIGLKTAGGDEAWYSEMRKYLSGISIFVPGHLLATGMKYGARGSYSNVACLNPAATQKWTDLMIHDLPSALEIEHRLRKFFDAFIKPFINKQGYSGAACDRLLALIGGWADIGTNMRWPYRSIPEIEADRLRVIAKSLIPEFFKV